MWRSKRYDPPLTTPLQPAGQDDERELSAAWKSLNQTKAALRHIENRLEAAPGSGVLLESLMDTKKSSGGATRKVSRRDGRRTGDCSQAGRTSVSRTRSRGSPDKSSRSPLRNTTQNSNVRRSNCVEFKEPLVSYREHTPPPLTSSQLDGHSLQSDVALLTHSPGLNQLVDGRDSPDTTHSSALDSTMVRYLNDRPALEALRSPEHIAAANNPYRVDGSEVRVKVHTPEGPAETSVSSSPGSASQRLENLRRRQPDDKLEKLKERIRRQREHLEEAAERDRLLGYLEQPVGFAGSTDTIVAPTAKVRKVAPAPPAPVYQGFNSTETKIRTPDGKVWREEEFYNLSREIYRDQSHQLSESAKPQQQPTEKAKSRKPSKPVRKVHRTASVPNFETKPVISTTSWREGQKLVKMVLGPPRHVSREAKPEVTDRLATSGPHPRSNSYPRPDQNRHSRPSTSDGPHSRARMTRDPTSSGPAENGVLGSDLLSADIRGILDDLQLECRAEGRGPVEPKTGWESRVRTKAWMAGGSSLRGSRSASPAKRNKPEPTEPGPKKRHYDADSVRQYIARQQEERRRRQLEERRAQKEEAERKNQRLQELYRKQREGVANKAPAVIPEGPVQKRLQETYTKLLLEHVELGEEPPQAQPTTSTDVNQQRPLYQPSGESDKENRRQERPQSASSSSDLSLTEPPPLSRNELGLGVSSWLQPDHLSPVVRPHGQQAPPADQLLSQILDLKKAARSAVRDTGCLNRPHLTVTGAATTSKMNRIEALKATAASLSTRIESEARKLAGAGINYGCTRDVDVTAYTPSQGDGRWANPVSPPVREATDATNQLALRIQRLLNSAQSTYERALPGVGDLQGFQDQKQRTSASGGWAPTAPSLSVQPEVGKTNTHDSSCDSISEGPLQSECSLSEGDASPGANTKVVPKPAERLGVVDFCAGQRESFQPISHFMREAGKYPSLSPLAQDSSQGPWEELAKGSPHSVINIFTKNHLYNHANVGREEVNRTSPSASNGIYTVSAVDGAAVYEDDFVSSRSGGSTQAKRGHNGHSGIASGDSHYEELMNRRSPYVELASLPSSGSTPRSSPNSKSSVKRGDLSDKSDATLLEEQKSPCSPGLVAPSRESRRCGSASERSSGHSLLKNTYSDCTLGGASGLSLRSLGLENKKSPRSLSPAGSPPGSGSPRISLGSNSLAGADSPGQGSGSPHLAGRPSSSSSVSSATRGKSPANGCRTESKPAEDLHYTPGVLHQRMSAELNYLESIEESVRQLGDVERIRGVSLAQQESVSLAQILKAQQQRHERDLYELKVKAEEEALETQRQLEETRQKAARAHVELQENMAQTQQQSLEGMQDTATKMMNQQAESVRYTAEAARQIKEMTELARSQIAGAIGVPAIAPMPSLLDHQRQHHHPQPCTDTDVSRGDVSVVRTRTEAPSSSLDSRSDSIPSRRPTLSGGESSSHLSGWSRKVEAGYSAAEVEAHTAIDEDIPSDSAQSHLDDKDATSIATEYSLKFDESMTEDEIEERSFRSLLPSESHRRGATEKKRCPHEESEEEPSQERTSALETSKQHQPDGSMVFSSGQDSFSRFTMDMVRQYMKEEEVRAHHQSSLLRLRQRALKEKTKAELAWLEHQKRRLRDKGEDDKMPPIRKKQRGLLLKLQQEQAEIKRLQEANKAARKERQLLLKQQEDIERMRHTTQKLKERLKCASDNPPEPSVSELRDRASYPSVALTVGDVRSASPLSVSGSETSSIMQKLKKMRSHMDEKFLTKREQGLMQRKRHAEELLQWKQRLDAEEVEVRRMEQEALAVWERDAPRNQTSEHSDGFNSSSAQHSPQARTDTDSVSEAEHSAVVTDSSVHTEFSGTHQPEGTSSVQPGFISELPSTQHSPSIYTQDFDSPSGGKASPSPKASLSTNTHPEASSSSSKMQLSSSSRTAGHDPKTTEITPATHAETKSDQSNIESRIHALKEELRKRKTVVYQLKKEQKKRHKERLKAQEASLLKQLESYNDFITKTKTELNKEPDLTPSTKTHIKTPISDTEEPKIKPLLPYRPETSKNHTVVTDSGKADRDLPDSSVGQADLAPSGLSKNISGHEDSDDDPSTVTQTSISRSPEHRNGLSGRLSPEPLLSLPSVGALPLMKPARLQATGCGDDSVISSHCSGVLEELELMKSEGSEHSQSRPEDYLVKLEQGPASKQSQSLLEPASSKNGKQMLTPTSSLDNQGKSAMSLYLIKEKPYTPEAEVISSKKDILSKVEETSPVPSADGYLEDFESSVELSLGEDNQGSKPTSTSYQDTRDALHSAEEDIIEELSERSGVTSGSPECILDRKSQETILPQENIISSPVLDEMPNFNIGDRVLVSNVQPGTLRFKGSTSFANGIWAGVELDKSEGSNNGTYDDVVYFECLEGHGIFAPPDKISHLPERFEIYVDTTEDEDSFIDDQSDNELKRHDLKKEPHLEETNEGNNRQVTSHLSSGGNKATDLSDGLAESPKNLTILPEVKEAEYPIYNGRTKTLILDLQDVPTSVFITDKEGTIALGKQTLDETTTLIERRIVDAQRKSTPEQTDLERDALSTFADKILNNLMKDAVKQFTQIRKAKDEKVAAANQMKVDLFNGKEGRHTFSQSLSVQQGDGLLIFLESDQDELLSSPELSNRPESPVLGASGQEELAKRLAELEMSRELLDELGDEQDWFDEDYGLSSRREQQKQRQQQEEEEHLSTDLIVTGDHAKTPPRPELPLQPKLPEQPAMVVPHSTPEVEKLVHAATQEIWDRCKLGQGKETTLPCLSVPKPSEEYLGCDAKGQDQESQCVRSYRLAVYDLTWEIIQEVFAEDPNAHQPQWMKPRRTNSSNFHRVKSTRDITRVKAFITTEVLRLYGLKKDRNQKTDWQKMLKFGRKKRDRVDHILVQELHEEESQWVNYDEDELYVKMQLADGIFDTLIKDTAEVLSQIQEKRSKTVMCQ
ncbi:hypothetical protein DPEC_G00266090 [Dallia pectoralis]|uniref:Uncharacterized protein n=1 Tax=Dallia pectoralis TaxID=75939 RepID=A0ACC2FNA9_DALPE|nr:hypothetical protein DPEC_G00266090 [Dallia pectoralis]